MRRWKTLRTFMTYIIKSFQKPFSKYPLFITLLSNKESPNLNTYLFTNLSTRLLSRRFVIFEDP